MIFRHKVHSIFTLLLLLTLFLVEGCGGPAKPPVLPGPAIPGLNLSGGYDCAQFGFMKIKHMGNEIRGTYEGIRQHNDKGSFLGKVEGDLIWIEWNQPGENDSVILPKQGKGWLRILEGGRLLKGKWGYDLSRDNGGNWLAERSEYY